MKQFLWNICKDFVNLTLFQKFLPTLQFISRVISRILLRTPRKFVRIFVQEYLRRFFQGILRNFIWNFLENIFNNSFKKSSGKLLQYFRQFSRNFAMYISKYSLDDCSRALLKHSPEILLRIFSEIIAETNAHNMSSATQSKMCIKSFFGDFSTNFSRNFSKESSRSYFQNCCINIRQYQPNFSKDLSF